MTRLVKRGDGGTPRRGEATDWWSLAGLDCPEDGRIARAPAAARLGAELSVTVLSVIIASEVDTRSDVDTSKSVLDDIAEYRDTADNPFKGIGTLRVDG